MKQTILLLAVIGLSITSVAQDMKKIKGVYDAQIDKSTAFNSSNQIKDTFAVAGLLQNAKEVRKQEQIKDTFAVADLLQNAKEVRRQEQIKDTFAFASLQKHLVPLKQGKVKSEGGLSITIKDNAIVLKYLDNQQEIAFNRKDVKVKGKKYTITPQKGEKIFLEDKGGYLTYVQGKNHFKLYKR